MEIGGTVALNKGVPAFLERKKKHPSSDDRAF